MYDEIVVLRPLPSPTRKAEECMPESWSGLSVGVSAVSRPTTRRGARGMSYDVRYIHLV